MVRVTMAIVMGVLVLLAVWFLPAFWFGLLIFLIAVAGLHEYGRMFLPDGLERAGTIIGGGIVAATMLFCPDSSEAVSAMLSVIIFAVSLFFMWRTKELPGVAGRVSLAMFGILYLGFAFPFWGWLRSVTFGRELVLLALVPACLCDTFAFLAGKTFGRHKFAPLVSPNKTMEGFFGALLGSITGTFLVRWILLPFIPWRMAVIFAVVIWIVSPFGDLVESMLKRSCGVKDSGSLIPGHGGILDRLDALIFTGPAAYIFVRYVLGI